MLCNERALLPSGTKKDLREENLLLLSSSKQLEKSQFAIIILSKNYASSKWCLDELAKIIKCRKEVRLTLFPIFYNVDPSDIQKQIGPFEQASIDHQKCFEDNIKRVETWRATLREVADISGRHLQNR